MADIISSVEMITPDRARVLLSNKNGNRPISRARVEQYAKDMADGLWQITHQGLAIDDNGRLVDGQTRCEAIIKTNKPIMMMVTYGVPSSMLPYMDSGGVRSPSDTIAMDGVAPRKARMISTAVLMILNQMASPTSYRGYINRREGNVNNRVLELYQRYRKDLMEAADFVSEMPSRDAVLSSGVAVFFRFVLRHHDDIEEFLCKLLTGADLNKNDVVFELRKEILHSRLRNMKMRDSVVINRTIAAFEAFHNKKQLKDWRQYLFERSSDQIIKGAL